ncbi:UNVERIFIED_CONTAM: hypothetical protein FKN15_070374 [Acipenser sinensis]
MIKTYLRSSMAQERLSGLAIISINHQVGSQLALSVTVASVERSFSKLKMIKTYLRSSMAQERLSGQAIISINHQVGSMLSYDEVINDFASKAARRQKL